MAMQTQPDPAQPDFLATDAYSSPSPQLTPEQVQAILQQPPQAPTPAPAPAPAPSGTVGTVPQPQPPAPVTYQSQGAPMPAAQSTDPMDSFTMTPALATQRAADAAEGSAQATSESVDALQKLAEQHKVDLDKTRADLDQAQKTYESNEQLAATSDADKAQKADKFYSDATSWLDQQHRKYSSDTDALKNYNYWDNKSSGQKAMALIGLALGGIGASLQSAGGQAYHNHAADQLGKMMDQDYHKQLASVDAMKDSVAMAQTGVNDAARAKELLRLDLDSKHRARLDDLEQKSKLLADKWKWSDDDYNSSRLSATLNAAKATAAATAADHVADMYRNADKDEADKAYKMAETTHAYAAADEARARGRAYDSGGVGPLGEPGKNDIKFFNTYAKPHLIQATQTKNRVDQLDESVEAAAKPDVSYGELKQALINSYAARTGKGTRNVSVADLKEVMPDLFSGGDRLWNMILSGGEGKASPDVVAKVQGSVGAARDYWLKKYNEEGDQMERNLPTQDKDKAHQVRQQIYPDRVANVPTALPAGIPAGSVRTPRTAKGLPVYQAPDGSLHVAK